MTGVTLRGPADVLGIVPYLLGYHPEHSLVALGLDGSRIVFGARCDLPGAPAPSGPGTVWELAARITRVVVRQQVTAAMLVGYGTPDAAEPALRATRAMLRLRRVPVPEVIRADGGRYWCPECADRACCPPEGIPYDTRASVVAAEATLAGWTALPDRAALEARVATADPDLAHALRSTTRRASSRLRHLLERAPDPVAEVRAAARAAVAAAFERSSAGADPTDDEAAWLGVLLEWPTVWEDTRVRLGTGHPHDHVRLWLGVLRRTTPDRAAPVAALLGFAAWRDGDGALAGIAVDRALRADPRFPPARLLDELLYAGVPPDGKAGARSPAAGR